MSPSAIDLSHFKKKIRGKIKLAIFMSMLLHLIYLAIKNFGKRPDQLAKYDSFLQLVSDKEFIAKILAKESRSGRLKADPSRYLKPVDIMK